jgi:hypothetical protein
MHRTWPRIIAHADMDAFYAAGGATRRSVVRGRPLIIGPNSNRGVVLTASYEARPFGVHSAMPMARARKLCPDALIVPPRFDRYTEISEQVMKVFGNFSPEVEATEPRRGVSQHVGQRAPFRQTDVDRTQSEGRGERGDRTDASVGVSGQVRLQGRERLRQA